MTPNLKPSQEAIASATRTLLSDDNYLHIKNAVEQLHKVFAKATGVEAGDITDKDIELPTGTAVSTIKAAHCLKELERTRRFLRGIYAAIDQLLEKGSGEPVHIFYAGCGPYATLLTPFTSLFTSQQLQFTLLDINEASLDAARTLFDTLDLADYVREYICTDATTYRFPQGSKIDIVISETMLNALRKEPQLAIMNNLIPQMAPHAIFIPEEITIDAVLTRWEEEKNSFFLEDYQPKRIKAGTVYQACREFKLPEPVIINVPASETHHRLDLFTDIKVYGEEMLSAYNCSLNIPLHVAELNNQSKEVTVKFNYIMSEKPGFVSSY
ncbi:hypothetical protein MUY27_03185 [Mucilaginibacter sp. RS28]|uniref:Methyltransferase domain-containing protein n=1 Tax=Mucilaginibacter straminoryzae TaxID=2932774 RepID=A0A9X2B7T3_9SPHI|nr:hypothetical protein [Mucilaginibacter straminoryzae]MCJ8208696.1 hypothetical protein [Mucilaginibacter straminoryzae]